MNSIQIFSQNIGAGPGNSGAQNHLLEIIIMLLGAFILGYLVRYFIGMSGRKQVARLQKELDELRSHDKGNMDAQKIISSLETKVVQLEQKNNDLRMQLSSNQTDLVKYKLTLDKNMDLESQLAKLKQEKTAAEWNQHLANKVTPPQPEVPPATMPIAVKNEEVDQSDLKKIEGIGPKIQELLNAGGIVTFSDLADKTSDQIRDLLLAEGPQYKVHDPGTWPEQASMARDNKWTELLEWQARLKGGKAD